MRLEAFPAPPFYQNAYLLAADTGQAAIIDPGDGTEALVDRARALDLDVVSILLTHAHLDHISGVALARRTFDAPVHLHPADRFLYESIVEQGRLFGLEMSAQPAVDRELAAGLIVNIGPLAIRVHETPGHSPGGVVFEIREPDGHITLLTGDTLFAGSIGRTDLPGGDRTTLVNSIRRVLLVFGDDVPAYPGHGEPTTIGNERAGNPFLQ